jgi:hypothetical protein
MASRPLIHLIASCSETQVLASGGHHRPRRNRSSFASKRALGNRLISNSISSAASLTCAFSLTSRRRPFGFAFSFVVFTQPRLAPSVAHEVSVLAIISPWRCSSSAMRCCVSSNSAAARFAARSIYCCLASWFTRATARSVHCRYSPSGKSKTLVLQCHPRRHR